MTLECYAHFRKEPLGIDTNAFLDFIVISDRVRKYTNGIPSPENPNHVIPCDEKDTLVIKGKFSGAMYPLEGEMAAEIFPFVRFPWFYRLNGKFLKGVLFARKKQIEDAVLHNRPAGTIVVFKFPYQNNEYLIKAFVFS